MKAAGKDLLSVVVVTFSLALSMVDLEESGWTFSSARSVKDLRKVSDMLKMFVVRFGIYSKSAVYLEDVILLCCVVDNKNEEKG
jgi:hypothetical protein